MDGTPRAMPFLDEDKESSAAPDSPRSGILFDFPDPNSPRLPPSRSTGLFNPSRPEPTPPPEMKLSSQQAILQEWKSRAMPEWARPREVDAVQLRVEHAWHRTRGHDRSSSSMAEHSETLNQVLNKVVPPRTPHPPQAPRWPVFASQVGRDKERFVNKLYDRLSDQRGPHFNRVTVESVCLAHHLQNPMEPASPRRQPLQGAWQPQETTITQRVHLPKLQLNQDWTDVQAATFNTFHAVAATPRFAQMTGTGARHKFAQVQEGWQPWRTHRSSAFDAPRTTGPPYTRR